MKITLQTLRHYKLAGGCPQCERVKNFGETKPGLTHTEAYRKRILEAIVQSTEGKAKVDRHEERIDRAIAERIRVSDEAQVSATPAQAHGDRVAVAAGAPSQPCGDRDDVQAAPPSDPQMYSPAIAVEDPADDIMDADGQAQDARGNQDAAGDDYMVGSVATVEDEYLNLIGMLGTHTGAFKRETRKAFNRTVSEIYSPPRVTRMASLLPSLKLLPGYAFDITQNDPDDGMPWDFDIAEKRAKAQRLLNEQRPLFLVGSPMCTAWCT